MRWIFNPDVLRRTRETLGLSPSAFARRVKTPMSGHQIMDIETGRRGLTVDTLLRLCNEYDLPPTSFFQRVEPNQEKAGSVARSRSAQKVDVHDRST